MGHALAELMGGLPISWWIATSAYLINRIGGIPLLGESIPFLQNHFADCLTVSVALPPLMIVYQSLGISKGLMPTHLDVLLHVTVWSLLCEGPWARWLCAHSTPDPIDVLCYAGGGVMAIGIWKLECAAGWWSPDPYADKTS